MGYIAHDAIIVTTDADCRPGGLPDINAFRASLPPPFQPLVIGPVKSIVNDYVSYVFLPDGSKEGWDTSDEGDDCRARFVALFDQRYEEDGSTHDKWVGVRFGGSAEYGDAAKITGSYEAGVAA
ncbi:hypothetical protein ABT336_14440 [Micromonospora sp. NPDC000207]|uniref:hypothetical protein n=1 Tax=Micromonospora sp. NPDC000207 TaxID=3154246 RepID=UPI00332DAB7D